MTEGRKQQQMKINEAEAAINAGSCWQSAGLGCGQLDKEGLDPHLSQPRLLACSEETSFSGGDSLANEAQSNESLLLYRVAKLGPQHS